MKFSIVSSFYNYIDAADELASSILNQTYDNWEWLICDDFSDNEEVSSKLKEIESLDDRIRIIYPRWKKEYYYNLPVSESTGDIMVIIDSDDIPSPKLLEVYKHNFEKFPDVISIGCSSLHKKNGYDGPITGAKYINYKNSSNYIEGNTNGVHSVIGDARSYRINMLKNNGVFVGENDFKFLGGEDVFKSIHIEEWGKFFAIPRVLYYYSMRYNSDSGGFTVHKTHSEEQKKQNKIFFDNVHVDAENRVSRDSLFSIEKYYDSSFDHAKNFYFSGIESQTQKLNIEYWSNNVLIEDKLKLNEIYFDHKIFYNELTPSPNMVIINSIDNVGLILKSLKDRKLENCVVVVTTTHKNKDNVSNMIKSLGYGFWFNIFNYVTFKLRF